MVIKYKDKEITSLEDIQKLKVKELRDILKCNSEAASGTKANLVQKVVRLAENVEENVDNSGDFKYEETLRWSRACVSRYSIKMKILSMLGPGYFLKITKSNSQQLKPICPNCKN